MRKLSGTLFAAAQVAGVAILLVVFTPPSSAQPGGFGGRGGGANLAALAAEPTPRLANGKPDLSGSWGTISGSYRGAGGGMFRRCTPFQDNCMEWTNQSADYTFMHVSRQNPNRPLYKPEYWDKVQALDMWTNRDDPVMTCLPLGIPRQGPPTRIFHTDADITMFWRGGLDGGGGYNEFRMTPFSRTEHSENDAYAFSYFGVGVAHWEGDTLVMESIGFSDETWLGRGGYFHTDQMKLIERFTRTGNTMLYEVIVEDPEVLVEPWVLDPRVLGLSNNPTIIAERGACTDVELDEVATQWRH
jgi:hypothetical protein